MTKIVLSCLLVSMALAANGRCESEQLVLNSEFGLALRPLSGARICTDSAGGHAHGFWVPLESKNCDDRALGRVVVIEGNYNTTFKRSPTEILKATCSRKAMVNFDHRFPGLRIGERPTIGCRVRHLGELVNVYLAAQAGAWTDRDDPESFGAPYVNLTATLRTDAAHEDTDVRTFSALLARLVTTDLGNPSSHN